MKLTLGYSPCPNDTFIFDAMVHGRIDTEGLEFEVQHADVEALNTMAFEGTLDITKLSYHAYAYMMAHYALLHAGSALGNQCGPLLIAKKPYTLDQLKPEFRLAIPGKYTTANFLLSWALPQLTNKQSMVFSDIEKTLLDDEVDLGLIIHENRFTYAAKGLHKVIDLGEHWEAQTGLPIPLGGIVTRRNYPPELQAKINRVLRRSVEYAFAHPEASLPYVRAHAQEMDDQVMRQHINLYVNTYSVDLGTQGRAAIERLFQEAAHKKIIPTMTEELFTYKED